MGRYLLDTGPLTALRQGRTGAVNLLQSWVQNGEAATSILAYGEAVEYRRPKPNYPAHLQALHELLEGVRPFFLTYPILRRYADTRLGLRPRGQLSRKAGRPLEGGAGQTRPWRWAWATAAVRESTPSLAIKLVTCPLNGRTREGADPGGRPLRGPDPSWVSLGRKRRTAHDPLSPVCGRVFSGRGP